jgi:glyoxylase-like metal-dependent hydrolase (beta-lactamase superfamily II)/rhodanese-related sulfurtransferase
VADVLVRQFVDDSLGCASYLVGDLDSGECVVVDPAFFVEPYIEEAARSGLRIVGVLETHTHADHVSGHGRLALEHGLPISIHAAAGAVYDHHAIEDGDTIEVGQVRIDVIHTPGHRPEHCSFALRGAPGEGPSLVLAGDSLLVGDAARPDLAVAAREGADLLYESLRRLLELGDAVEVLPGHVAGSLCGRRMSAARRTTIGAERRNNPALATLGDREAFIRESSSISVPRPPGLERIVDLNRGPFVAAPPPPRPLEDAGGAVVLDVRPATEYVGGHVEGAINVPITGSSFATKAGFVLDQEERVAVHASSEDEARRAIRGLHSVGFFDIAGWLVAPAATRTLTPVGLDELDRLIGDGTAEVIDVRETSERDGGYIPGTRHIPYRLLRAGAFHALDRERPVVTICESGARAAIAASVLAAAGFDARPLLEGGIAAWEAAGGRTIEFRRCGGS